MKKKAYKRNIVKKEETNKETSKRIVTIPPVPSKDSRLGV